MSRIGRRFAALKKEGRGALIPYVEAFDPDYATSLELLRAMPAAGADLIEIGVPFSDPSADGPVIQEAALRGLKAGATLGGVLQMVRDFRETDDETPVILMGYLNPIDSYGPAEFCFDAAQAGVDGLIVVDMPSEESDMLAQHAKAAGLDIISLVAPTTSRTRLFHILREASGFVYYVSITGITGTSTASRAQLEEALPRIREATALPVAIGFGISTPEQAREASRIGDAAVVASALIRVMAATLEAGAATPRSVPAVLERLEALAAAVRG